MTRLLAAGAWIFLATCFLGAQPAPDPDDDAEPSSSNVYVRPSPNGNVSFRVSSYGLTKAQDAAVLKTVPLTLACRWIQLDRSEYSIEGICRGLLKPERAPSTVPLDLAPLTAALHEAGSQVVEITAAFPAPLVNPPARWQAVDTLRPSRSPIRFLSNRPGLLPPSLPVLVEYLFNPARVAVQILVILLVPAILAYGIRARASRANAEQKVNWMVWMNWINLGAWLYWITALQVEDIAEFGGVLFNGGYLATLPTGVALYSLPPLLSLATCFTAMAPLLSSSKASFMLLLKRQLVASAKFIVPFGIFLVSSGMTQLGYSSPLVALVAAYVVYRAIAWTEKTMSYQMATALDSGDLFDRAAALARKAGVALTRLTILRTRVSEEANAYAVSGGSVVLTESLINGLTAREVDAVIAHELGHHKAGHLRFDMSMVLLVVYVVIAGPLIGWLYSHFHIPSWGHSVPIFPVLFIMLQASLSQRNEYTADARAIDLTGDPEGKIAALGRLAQLSRIPLQSGIMGSIMSHPSMERRVLALARRGGVADERALAILRNPDEAYTDEPSKRRAAAGMELPSVVAAKEPEFSTRRRVVFFEQLSWLQFLTPLAALIALTAVANPIYYSRLPFGHRALLLLLLLVCIPMSVFFTICAEVALSSRFASRHRGAIAKRLQPAPDARFVGIHPGHAVRFTEGFPDWDFGFVSLEGDWLCYRGEKARFAIPRQALRDITIVAGPVAWLRERRVQVSHSGGVLTLGPDFSRPTKRKCRQLAGWLRDWADAASSVHPVGPPPEPAPAMPYLLGIESGRLIAAWTACKQGLKLLLTATALLSVTWRWIGMAVYLVPFLGAIAGFCLEIPRIFWPVRRPASQPEFLEAAEPLKSDSAA